MLRTFLINAPPPHHIRSVGLYGISESHFLVLRIIFSELVPRSRFCGTGFFCVYGILVGMCNKISVENVIKTVCLIKEG